VTGASALSVAGQAAPLEDDYAEFAIREDGGIDTTGIALQRSPFVEDHPPFLASEPVPPVTISGEEGLDVRYTLDGSDPTADSPRYTGAFSLAEPATVKARYLRGKRPLPFVAAREYRPVFYEPRPADYPLTATFPNGLACAEIRHKPGIRLYDLMRQNRAFADTLEMMVEENTQEIERMRAAMREMASKIRSLMS